MDRLEARNGPSLTGAAMFTNRLDLVLGFSVLLFVATIVGTTIASSEHVRRPAVLRLIPPVIIGAGVIAAVGGALIALGVIPSDGNANLGSGLRMVSIALALGIGVGAVLTYTNLLLAGVLMMLSGCGLMIAIGFDTVSMVPFGLAVLAASMALLLVEQRLAGKVV